MCIYSVSSFDIPIPPYPMALCPPAQSFQYTMVLPGYTMLKVQQVEGKQGQKETEILVSLLLHMKTWHIWATLST